MPLPYQVNIFLLMLPFFYILFSELNFSGNPQLRFLQFNLRFEDAESREMQDDVIRGFSSICESVTSRSLVVEVYGLPKEWEVCSSIQNTLLALSERVENFCICLSEIHWDERVSMKKGRMQKLFSRLYEVGMVVENFLDDEESVSRYSQTSSLLY